MVSATWSSISTTSRNRLPVLGDGADLDVRVRYSWEHRCSDRRADRATRCPCSWTCRAARTCLLVNGDTLTDVDLRMIAASPQRGAQVTMALIPNPRPDKYGGVLLDDGWVTGFTKRRAPGTSPVPSEVHFIGPQVVRAGAFLPLEDGVPSESVLGLYPLLMKARPVGDRATSATRRSRTSGRRPIACRPRCELAAADGVARPHWGRGVGGPVRNGKAFRGLGRRDGR